MKPSDASNRAVVPFEHLWSFGKVKFVNVNRASICNCKEMTAMRKLNFTAHLDLNVFVRCKRFFKKIHHANAFIKTYYDVET